MCELALNIESLIKSTVGSFKLFYKKNGQIIEIGDLEEVKTEIKSCTILPSTPNSVVVSSKPNAPTFHNNNPGSPHANVLNTNKTLQNTLRHGDIPSSPYDEEGLLSDAASEIEHIRKANEAHHIIEVHKRYSGLPTASTAPQKETDYDYITDQEIHSDFSHYSTDSDRIGDENNTNSVPLTYNPRQPHVAEDWSLKSRKRSQEPLQSFDQFPCFQERTQPSMLAKYKMELNTISMTPKKRIKREGISTLIGPQFDYVKTALQRLFCPLKWEPTPEVWDDILNLYFEFYEQGSVQSFKSFPSKCIQFLYPERRRTHPYTYGNSPEWWPTPIRYIDPPHLHQEERICLVLWIMICPNHPLRTVKESWCYLFGQESKNSVIYKSIFGLANRIRKNMFELTENIN